ncbi:hypothetical protein QBC34DRAFT_470608 [Podospora aff. communis PSN243]|uniref:Uncharacterized protein n=1 Tax=Podospora aff. communis PSN243 TaxID=3040156 RepID=A0AAV9GCX9_9PEZI|nr:hypothetical protein QBC34DRAFT_470608 [Podospora aff. communis PSN243]
MAMSRQQYPSTCLSDKPHELRVSDVTTHFNGCLRVSKRRKFFESLPLESQSRIIRDNERIVELRHRLETPEFDSTAASRLRDFKLAMANWSVTTGRPHASHASTPGHDSLPDSRRPSGLPSYSPSSHDVNEHIKAPVVYFKDGIPTDAPGLPNHFPTQHVTMADLLSQDPTRNPILQPSSSDTIRYFHLPANNMIWVEEVVARYYGETRPSSDDLYLKSHLRRSRTQTETLLRPEFWQGQACYDAKSEVHARHMRPLCAPVSLSPCEAPKNLVLFMPYLHWETDRGRVISAEIIKEADRALLLPRTITEVVSQAQNQLQRTTTGDTTAPVLPAEFVQQVYAPDRASRRAALGALLKSAAGLAEAMAAHVEEQMVVRYLHAEPPLHPRRTLDQSYYGALKSTRARDRDQVVYRGTMPAAHECDGRGVCATCREDVRRVPRLVMVDQLWLWVLDEGTVISCFPRRFGKNRPDPSAVHKTLRQRFRQIRPGEISSAYDLALLIVDECSRVFFDRARTDDRTPNLVELFAGAIRDLTYKQTAAFDQFLIYTHLASGDYKRDQGGGDSNSNQNTLLNINPEGNLLKEVKDIVDEIAIMMRIKEQQQAVMESLVKHIRRVMMPLAKTPKKKTMSQDSSAWDVLLGAEMEAEPSHADEISARERDNAKRTIGRADQLLVDLQERMEELRALLRIAQTTSSALKDILTLKQQQAGVIEAREAVKQAQLTLKQGQSIMIFTIVTIIFLPLSFCVGFFGMNNVEFNDGALALATELQIMFPVSIGIIMVALVLGFSHSVRSNALVEFLRSAVSFAWNTGVTWVSVRSGMYMAGRDMARRARRLREREGKVTGGMKAEVMRREKNVERMRAAGHLAVGQKDGSGTLAVTASGRNTPMFSPYGSAGPGSPFVGHGNGEGGGRGQKGMGFGRGRRIA